MEFIVKHTIFFVKIAFLSGIACLLLSSHANAAERIALHHITMMDLKKWVSLPWEQTVAEAEADLVLIERHQDSRHVEHMRMQQRYAGVPVWGADAVFHRAIHSTAQAPTMNGVLYQKLQQDLGAVPMDYFSKASTLLQRYCQQFPANEITDSKVTFLIYVDSKQQAHWAYQVRVVLQPENAMPSRPAAIIAFEDGHVLMHWNDLPTSRTMIHGLGFGGNKKIGKYQFGKELPILSMLRNDMLGQCYWENKQVRIVDMQHHIRAVNKPMSFDCEDTVSNDEYWTGSEKDGYDSVNGGYSVANDAMYMVAAVQDVYRKYYHQEILSYTKKPLHLVARIHYGLHYANAFWDGQQMTFGDGDLYYYPMVSLDITAHEMSHGFTEQHSALVYTGQSGGINEAFSDMAAQAVAYHIHGHSDWKIGASILKSPGALRFLDQPSRDGMSIDRADQYQPDMDVHYSSGVYNRLFYLLAHLPNWNPDKAFGVMLKANRDYWTPNETFDSGSCGILSATRDLGLNEDAVMSALDEVMIDYSDC